METPPPKKSLSIVSFAIHATRGVLRDQTTRRGVMFVSVIVAMALMFLGSSLLREVLNPREHPAWFIIFWFACGWMTLLSILLAVFDLLLVRAQARAEQKRFREEFAQRQTPDSPRNRDAE